MIKSFFPITLGAAVAFQCFNWAVDRLHVNLLPQPPGKYAVKDRHRWRNAATSFANSVVMTCVVAFCLLKHPELWNDPDTFYSAAADVNFAIFSGYLIYDTRDLMRHSYFAKVWSLVLHHVILVFSFVVLSWEQKGVGVMTIGLLSEFSAMFLHSRQLLLIYGVSKHSLVFGVHRLANVATFVLLRILPLVYACYRSYITANMPAYVGYMLPFLTTPICLINFVLLWRLICSDFLLKDKNSNVMDN